MPLQRQTAVRSRIVDLVSGEFVKKEGMEPSYVVTPGNENVSRTRVVGTIVGRFDSEDGNFSSLTIDDSTGTMRVKLWRELDVLKGFTVGQLVSVVGKVREYEGEIYVVPEIVKEVTPDEEALARLDILKKMKDGGARVSAPAQPAPAMPQQPEKPSVQESAPPAAPEPAQAPAPAEQPTAMPSGPEPELRPASEQPNEESPRMKVMGIIEKNADGIKYAELVQQAGLPEEQIEDVINELLGEGVCYEPMPGKIKKI